MPVNKVTIKLDKFRRVYHQGDYLTGKAIIENKYELKHEGVVICVEGNVEISTNLRGINFLDTFQGSSKSIMLIDFACEPLKAGILKPGRIEIPFKLPVDNNINASTLYETYHGVFISIQYFVKCRIKRSIFHKDILESLEFMVEYDPNPIGAPPLVKQPIDFKITPDTLKASRRDIIPNFCITGHLDSLICSLGEPITGEFNIESCDATIRSVELQLVRVESSGLLETDRDFSKDATEVQNIQIGDGDLLRNIPITIHMILPRSFTCPTLMTSSFRIEFELNLVIIFDDNYLITENFPLKLIRSTLQPIGLERTIDF